MLQDELMTSEEILRHMLDLTLLSAKASEGCGLVFRCHAHNSNLNGSARSAEKLRAQSGGPCAEPQEPHARQTFVFWRKLEGTPVLRPPSPPRRQELLERGDRFVIKQPLCHVRGRNASTQVGNRMQVRADIKVIKTKFTKVIQAAAAQTRGAASMSEIHDGNSNSPGGGRGRVMEGRIEGVRDEEVRVMQTRGKRRREEGVIFTGSEKDGGKKSQGRRKGNDGGHKGKEVEVEVEVEVAVVAAGHRRRMERKSDRCK
ncbi:unnamed protein product [Pleuronectes platessa]|uniref:Uncharacterized protein n=1 Tax=Pleuronectes platessa TaxID=8262 RepID=A0A9N7TI37_PLEPL|nr:unnamed protein product [Pleuronectes platessa]